MEILAGTSGFSYKEWKGVFYPDDLSRKDFLSYYAEHFRTVEINNTFYRMPKQSMLEGWAEQTPEGFEFVIKASRRITHFARIKESSYEGLAYLLSQTEALGDKLGAILFQLPPNLKKDVDRLGGFLEQLPGDRRVTLEFRHDSWFDDEVYDALRAHDVALCLADMGEGETPAVATADWGYLRLRRETYEQAELQAWVDRVAEQPWDRVYAFFKHEDAGAGPRMAQHFLELADASG